MKIIDRSGSRERDVLSTSVSGAAGGTKKEKNCSVKVPSKRKVPRKGNSTSWHGRSEGRRSSGVLKHGEGHSKGKKNRSRPSVENLRGGQGI